MGNISDMERSSLHDLITIFKKIYYRTSKTSKVFIKCRYLDTMGVPKSR